MTRRKHTRHWLGLALLIAAAAGCARSDGERGDLGAVADLGPTPDDGGALCQARTIHRRPRANSITVQRGVDRAGVFTPTEATTLASGYGVSWSGVYIGGACNAGSGWTLDSVTALAANTGWSFLPIYVGQQAPSICGASTLGYASGAADGADAASLLAGFAWGANLMIPVALDVEAGTFSYDAAGTTDYVHGWLDAVHTAGYLGYVYSSPTALNAFASAALPVDAVWVASYFYSGFADVAPDDLQQLGSNYMNDDRAWQYAGNVAIPGAGAIDCDASDLLLAPAPGGSNQTGPAPTPPPPPTKCGAIDPGQGLGQGDSSSSCNCRYALTLQLDGDLVVSSSAGVSWSSGTSGGAVAVMQSDGNFVVYDLTSAPLWATRTDGHPGARLALQDDGALVVYDTNGQILWSSSGAGGP